MPLYPPICTFYPAVRPEQLPCRTKNPAPRSISSLKSAGKIYAYYFIYPDSSSSGRKQPSFQSLLNLLISHNRSKRGFFLNRYIPINSCSFSMDWSINWCKWCRSFYPRSRNATYSLDTLLYSLLKYESRPSNSDCLSSFVTSV